MSPIIARLVTILALLARTAACTSERGPDVAERPPQRPTDTPPARDTARAEAPTVTQSAFDPDSASTMAEARAIAGSAGTAERHGDTLLVRLKSGELLALVNTPEVGDMVATYRYKGTLLGGQYHVVDVQWYESGAVILVDAETGARETIVNEPTLSPSGTLAVASAFSLDVGEGANEIQIWQLVPHPPKLVWRFDTPGDRVGGWGADRPVWRGDTLIEMVREIRLPGRQGSDFRTPRRHEPMRLVREDTIWRVDTLPH